MTKDALEPNDASESRQARPARDPGPSLLQLALSVLRGELSEGQAIAILRGEVAEAESSDA